MSGKVPYGRQLIDAADVEAVVRVLESEWLTTGPDVEGFERDLGAFVGAAHAVAVSNGTAALHAALHALGIGPGDEVIVPAMTFAASANCALYLGATPVFCDVEPDTLLVDVADVERKLGPKTRAIVAVDYAGQLCDYPRLTELARERGFKVVADACHALGAELDGIRAGSLADVTAFSFHPVKHITTGEGGMLTTQDESLARRMRRFRNHGIDSEFRERAERGTWYYEVLELGYNYRLSDIACALGRSQLKKLPAWLEQRRRIAAFYDAELASIAGVEPLAARPGARHAYHLYVVRIDPRRADRRSVFERMRGAGIGVNVHYVPVHLHPLYRSRLDTRPGMCPNAEAAYEEILSLPMHAGLTEADCERVVSTLRAAL